MAAAAAMSSWADGGPGRRAARAPCGLRTRGQPHTAGYIILYIAGTAAQQRVALGGFLSRSRSFQLPVQGFVLLWGYGSRRSSATCADAPPDGLGGRGWGFYGPRLVHTLPGARRPPEKTQLVLLPEVLGVRQIRRWRKRQELDRTCLACERDGRRVFSIKQSLLQMPFTRAQRMATGATAREDLCGCTCARDVINSNPTVESMWPICLPKSRKSTLGFFTAMANVR
jgi:hypothetical protein